jgi:hypothetical protein
VADIHVLKGEYVVREGEVRALIVTRTGRWNGDVILIW